MKLDFDIDRKSAKYKRRPIITKLSTFSFHNELVTNFSWNPIDSHYRYELDISLVEPDTGVAKYSVRQGINFYLTLLKFEYPIAETRPIVT